MNKHLFAIHLIPLVIFSGQSAGGEYDSRQAEVAERGAQVMPFALSRTLHQFDKTANGGIQRVIVRDASDQEQIQLIRRHLRQLAERFRAGDFSGPASIHGENMPGLKAMRQAGGKLHIVYAELADGASLTYTAGEADVIQAVHAWFDAQLRDHGHDAMTTHHHGEQGGH